MRPFCRGLAFVLLPLVAFACEDAKAPDMSGIDIMPALDIPTRDPGRDLHPWDYGPWDQGSDNFSEDASSTDTPDSMVVPDVIKGPGRIQVTPDSLDFGTVMGGGSVDRPLMLVSIGETPVSVLSIALSTASDPDFQILSIAGPDQVAPGALMLVVQYAPPEEASPGEALGNLQIITDSIEQAVIDVAVKARRIARTGCTLAIEPESFSLEFGDIPQGDTRDLVINLTNTGTIPCQIDTLVLRACANTTVCSPEDGNTPLFGMIDTPPLPSVIESGEDLSLMVRFPMPSAPSTGNATERAFLGLIHRVEGYGLPDPIIGHLPADCDPYGPCPPNVFGRIVAPVLAADPSSVSFGNVRVGCTSDLVPVAVTNESASTVTVKSVEIDPNCPLAGDIQMAGAPAPGTTITPTNAFVLKLKWLPSDDGPFACDLLVKTDKSADSKFRIPLAGTATPGGNITREFQLPSSDLDVLFVADGSSSMMDGLSRLGDAIPAFLAATTNAGRSVQMGVVGMSADPTCVEAGALLGPVRLMTPETANRFDEALAAVSESTCPSDVADKGLEAARWALSSPRIDDTGTSCAMGGSCPQPYNCVDDVCGGPNRGLLRAEAGLDIVFLSDADDQSPDTVADYVSFFQGVLGTTRQPGVRVFSIVGPPPTGCNAFGDSAQSCPRYDGVARQAGGATYPICITFLNDTLRAIAVPQWDLPLVLPLGAPPDPSTVEVLRNDIPCDGGFTFDASAWTVTLLPDGACSTGPEDRITVRFHTVCDAR